MEDAEPPKETKAPEAEKDEAPKEIAYDELIKRSRKKSELRMSDLDVTKLQACKSGIPSLFCFAQNLASPFVYSPLRLYINRFE